jgi:archaellum biogenesis protein FlaJ (TadC family)
MLEKLGGLLTIVIAVTGLALISVYQPPIYAQIILALVGSGVCLVGVVFLFAEGQIYRKDRKGKTAPKAG